MATENWQQVGWDLKKSDTSRTSELPRPILWDTARATAGFDTSFPVGVDTEPTVRTKSVQFSLKNEEDVQFDTKAFREHSIGVFRKTLFQAVLFIDLLEAIWIGAVVAVFLFIPEIRIVFVGSAQPGLNNTTLHSSPNISNNTMEDVTLSKGSAWLIAFCLLFIVTFVTTCVITFVFERREKRVPSQLFLFLLVNTFALLMGDIACLYQTEVMLSVMCLVGFAFIQLLLYLICTKRSPLSNSPHCTAMALVFHICLMSGVAFSISDLVYKSPWYYGLSSFLISTFFLVAALYHAWPGNEHDCMNELRRSHVYSYRALKVWFAVPLAIAVCFCKKRSLPSSTENEAETESNKDADL
ncbi:uncharacterized protein LOC135487010 [Lineus longissimus]|uniref:uncharacterized protein LOC135487010 n=1 Tax=Lineus longissimus TaxID=88925 RepID=UPI002B4EFDAF